MCPNLLFDDGFVLDKWRVGSCDALAHKPLGAGAGPVGAETSPGGSFDRLAREIDTLRARVDSLLILNWSLLCAPLQLHKNSCGGVPPELLRKAHPYVFVKIKCRPRARSQRWRYVQEWNQPLGCSSSPIRKPSRGHLSIPSHPAVQSSSSWCPNLQ